MKAAISVLLLLMAAVTIGADAKKVEDKMADALSGLNSWRIAHEGYRNVTGAFNASLNNSTNIATGNSSISSSSIANATPLNHSGVGTSTRTSFNGYFGMTASRHEIGKSDIKSSMFLRGGFEVDKSVQFQDRGF
ncbi:MAG: hypothetical protein A4E44_02201 [Methanosaeta sp. PtaB.Bin018]|nr:MAG: hypothetical protein A4E44_02201 [Methanosaeta sp. PtaB.Bin018]OPY45625.1 MAG: hypothetical protein A4E46_01204 [Methanosaeta sp. PtaU1.Bin016]